MNALSRLSRNKSLHDHRFRNSSPWTVFPKKILQPKILTRYFIFYCFHYRRGERDGRWQECPRLSSGPLHGVSRVDVQFDRRQVWGDVGQVKKIVFLLMVRTIISPAIIKLCQWVKENLEGQTLVATHRGVTIVTLSAKRLLKSSSSIQMFKARNYYGFFALDSSNVND